MRGRTWVWLTLVGLVVVASVVAWRVWPVNVGVAEVQKGQAVEAVYATGVVEPTVQIPLAPRAGGRLVNWTVEEGAAVRRGQVLVRLEATDLERSVQEASARESLARASYERAQKLVAQQFLSPAELDRTRVEWEAARAAWRRTEAQRDYNVLVAPADGVVLRRDGERGQFIAAGQTIYTLACCAPLRVTAEVDEEDIARVRVGMPVLMRTDALPQRVFEGEVGDITPKGDPVARSYRVRIRFTGDTPMDVLGEGGLRVGMTMDANLIVARHDDVVLVPTAALRGQQIWVMVDGRVRRRTVTLGVKGGERTEVLKGVSAGEVVVLSPAEKLRDGQRAKAAAPSASAP